MNKDKINQVRKANIYNTRSEVKNIIRHLKKKMFKKY